MTGSAEHEHGHAFLPRREPPRRIGTLAIVLGDQLSHDSPILASLDPARDAVLMMETREESLHAPSHKQRTVLFLSAMRHFAADLERRGLHVIYSALDDPDNSHTFSGEVSRLSGQTLVQRARMLRPGEWRVLLMIPEWERALGCPVEIVDDPHFLTTPDEFAAWAAGRKSPVMESFYRWQRKRLDILMDDGTPAGGVWNFDRENRKSFGPRGPSPLPPEPRRFSPDATTRATIDLVERTLPRNPGSTDSFAWPVTRADALGALDDFIRNRLPLFGRYEDAMTTRSRAVYHSTLSAPLNLKLLDPRECVAAAVRALHAGHSPLQSVEAFVRQIIGWREFIRGIYWREGPSYRDRNTLDAHEPLPEFYWSGRTDMNCLKNCVGEVIGHGFGHHIQRLMVTGNLALLLGVEPARVNDWYLGMFVDGVDWATLPNVVGMALHADGGTVGTKPYAASGRYIQRMSDYCAGCTYDPTRRVDGDGRRACPFTTLYWDFLMRHRARLSRNHRMAMILRNLDRMSSEETVAITVSGERLRRSLRPTPSQADTAEESAPRSSTKEHRRGRESAATSSSRRSDRTRRCHRP